MMKATTSKTISIVLMTLVPLQYIIKKTMKFTLIVQMLFVIYKLHFSSTILDTDKHETHKIKKQSTLNMTENNK